MRRLRWQEDSAGLYVERPPLRAYIFPPVGVVVTQCPVRWQVCVGALVAYGRSTSIRAAKAAIRRVLADVVLASGT